MNIGSDLTKLQSVERWELFLIHSVLTPGLSWRLALHCEIDQENSSRVQCIYTVYAHYILNLLTMLELLQAGKSLALTVFIILA